MAKKKMKYHNKDKEFLENLRKEAEVLKNLNHPNIITFYGYTENKRGIELYFEYMSDGSIADLLKNF